MLSASNAKASGQRNQVHTRTKNCSKPMCCDNQVIAAGPTSNRPAERTSSAAVAKVVGREGDEAETATLIRLGLRELSSP